MCVAHIRMKTYDWESWRWKHVANAKTHRVAIFVQDRRDRINVKCPGLFLSCGFLFDCRDCRCDGNLFNRFQPVFVRHCCRAPKLSMHVSAVPGAYPQAGFKSWHVSFSPSSAQWFIVTLSVPELWNLFPRSGGYVNTSHMIHDQNQQLLLILALEAWFAESREPQLILCKQWNRFSQELIEFSGGISLSLSFSLYMTTFCSAPQHLAVLVWTTCI